MYDFMLNPTVRLQIYRFIYYHNIVNRLTYAEGAMLLLVSYCGRDNIIVLTV